MSWFASAKSDAAFPENQFLFDTAVERATDDFYERERFALNKVKKKKKEARQNNKQARRLWWSIFFKGRKMHPNNLALKRRTIERLKKEAVNLQKEAEKSERDILFKFSINNLLEDIRKAKEPIHQAEAARLEKEGSILLLTAGDEKLSDKQGYLGQQSIRCLYKHGDNFAIVVERWFLKKGENEWQDPQLVSISGDPNDMSEEELRIICNQ